MCIKHLSDLTDRIYKIIYCLVENYGEVYIIFYYIMKFFSFISL